MVFLEQYQTSVFALLVLLILFVVISQRLRVTTYGKRLLITVMVFTTVAIILDIVSWEVDGKQFWGAFVLEYGSNFLLVLIAPIISGLMLAYVRYKLLDRQTPIKRVILRFPPLWFTIMMLVINVFEPVYFSVNLTTNYFSSESLLWVHFLMLFGTYVYMTSISIYYQNKSNRHFSVIFILFFLLPIVGMGIQILESNVFFSWNFIVLSILVIVIFLEAADGETDYLTNLFNRRSYEAYVGQLMRRGIPFGVLYCDLDHFKTINDLHGHLTGDKVLIGFSNVLQDMFPDDMVIRLGGDEFMVVLESEGNPDDIARHVQTQLNMAEEPLNDVHFSYGYQQYEAGMTMDEIYSAVDAKMYEYKRKNKLLRRRRDDE